jgi:hypothetical protein
LPDSVARAASECLAKPNAPPPQGKHWYYNTDRGTKRRCWYLGPQGNRVHSSASRAASSERSPARPKAETAPATPQRTIADVIREMNAEAPAKATVGEGAREEFPSREPNQPAVTGAIGSSPVAANEPTARDPARPDPEEGGSVWPVLTATPAIGEQAAPTIEQPVQAAAPPSPPVEQPPAGSAQSDPTARPWYVLAIAGTFAFAGFFGRAIYRRTAARRLGRHRDLERKLAAGSTMFARTGNASTFAAEVGHWADVARRQPKASDRSADDLRRPGRAARAMHHEMA